MALSLPFERPIATPSEINRRIRQLLEGEFDEVWVKGEIGNFTRAASGHLYFSLKDSQSQLRCVMWRGAALRLRFQPADGVEVEVRGKISVYEPRGEYQLVAAEMNPAGLGALYVALEALKKKLAAEGLFDPARKRRLPRHPVTVGIVTSPTGAAVRDIIRVARARWPGIGLVLAPARVQGEGAAEEIAAAIRLMNLWGGADVLIVGRGGGSVEDLWAFNEEAVVRAVAGSAIPTVSAVGHEVDFTLCDLAADVRAATPSNAAELVVPDVREQAQRVDEQARRLGQAAARLLADNRRRVEELRRELPRALALRVGTARARLERETGRLSALDPMGVLSRGYCLVRREGAGVAPGAVVRQARDLVAGEAVRLQFSRDEARARIETVPEG